MQHIFAELGNFIQDIASGVFGGALVVSIIKPTYWWSLLIGLALLAFGFVLRTKYEQ